MPKKKKIYILLSVFAALCILTLIVSNVEEKKEDIKTNGESILEIDLSDVTNLSWTINKNTLSFSKDETWTYDDDTNFPLDETKISDLLGIFKSFQATYTIENVTDYSQYGLSSPVCTIEIKTSDNTYTIKLGDVSKADSQRYIDIGDGNAYLATNDPYDSYNVSLGSLILNDEIPSMKEVTSISFKGSETYTILKEEDKTSLCEDDTYFISDKALDNDLVDDYISTIKDLDLSNYVTYNVSDEELEEYGFNNPDLVISVSYNSKSNEEEQTLTLYVSSNVKELEEYNKASDEDKEDLSVTRYIRIGDSKIIYPLSDTKYDSLMSYSYDDLRHQEIFYGDFDSVTSIDISLDGNDYTFTNDDDTYKYNDEEIESTTLRNAITSLVADSFTSDTSTNQKEISITLNLDNEDYKIYKMDFYRYDGTLCLVYVDDKPYAYVSRSSVVDIIEAVNQIVLN